MAAEAAALVSPSASGSLSGGSDAIGKMEERKIGRWILQETIGKGGYSWVKRGLDTTTGKLVAMKFMAKADDSWLPEQKKQTMAEIEALKRIRHKHVLKLYAYNISTRYPLSSGATIETVLFVLEYAPCGELFDILYYTSALEPIIARSYFRQMISGLEACHKMGVCHRDLKPQNLLLDYKFRLKIADFGLAKIFDSAPASVGGGDVVSSSGSTATESTAAAAAATKTLSPRKIGDSMFGSKKKGVSGIATLGRDEDAKFAMHTSYVGTRGYQAPELLLKLPFGFGCDVFSSGVILFILLTGYPPFEQAVKSDRWFRPIAKSRPSKFWSQHSGTPISDDEACQDLIYSMLRYDPRERASLAEIQKHPWFNDKYLDTRTLVRVLQHRHKKMESKRRKDARKMKDLTYSYETSTASRAVGSGGAPVLSREMFSAVPLIAMLYGEEAVPASGKAGLYVDEALATLESKGTTTTDPTDDSDSDASPPAIEESYDSPKAKAQYELAKTIELETYPAGRVEGVWNMYTTVDWREVANVMFAEIVGLSGRALFNVSEQRLECALRLVADEESTVSSLINFMVEFWKSRAYQRDGCPVVYAINVRRISGDVVDYRKVVTMLFRNCARVLTGLPTWARKELKKAIAGEEDDEPTVEVSGDDSSAVTSADSKGYPLTDGATVEDESDDDSDAEYDRLLSNEGLGF